MNVEDKVLLHSVQDRAKCLRVEDNILFGSIQIIQRVAVISPVLVVVLFFFFLVLVLDHNLTLVLAFVVLVLVR